MRQATPTSQSQWSRTVWVPSGTKWRWIWTKSCTTSSRKLPRSRTPRWCKRWGARTWDKLSHHYPMIACFKGLTCHRTSTGQWPNFPKSWLLNVKRDCRLIRRVSDWRNLLRTNAMLTNTINKQIKTHSMKKYWLDNQQLFFAWYIYEF